MSRLGLKDVPFRYGGQLPFDRMDSYVVGVDGCRGGWVACRYAGPSKPPSFAVFTHFNKLAEAYFEAKSIAVDIPIGLRDDGVARSCDLKARVKLGPGRRSSVFPAPARCLLRATCFEIANRESRERFKSGISLAAFGIFPKVLEVDSFITPAHQEQIREVHPEVCFLAMTGRPMVHRKKTRAGYEERRTSLKEHFGVELPTVRNWHEVGIPPGQGVSRDDVLDAAVAAWTAWRVLRGENRRIPEDIQSDDRGLRMEMVF